MINATQVRKKRGRKWETTFTANDVCDVFRDLGPSYGIFYAAQFSLTWFVKQVFRTKDGFPLELMPFQSVMLDMLWTRKFPMVIASRGAGKTFMLALYSLLKALLIPGSKVVIVGAGFRQAKLVFKYIEDLYNASPLIQEAVGPGERPKYGSDAATLTVGLSTITAIPIGDGEKIRGLRATVLIADEFASIPEDIFDIVIAPFTAVHANPAQRARTRKFINKLKELGADPALIDSIESTQDFGNQIVLSGTPSHKQNHFYKRYEVYKMFLGSGGDPRKLKRALEERALHTTGRVDTVDKRDVEAMSRIWNQYSIFQLPYYGLPEDFLDEDQIRSDRAAFPRYRFEMEYEAKFPDDSDGFIKRSWIERATPRPPDHDSVHVELYGDPRATYVMGIDPARYNDNIAVVVLKLTDRGRELVYCEAWDATKYETSSEKIREIYNRFNIEYICMDHGGGGEAIYEWLCKKQDHVRDEDLIWVIPDQIDKYGEKADLAAPGRNVLEIVNFAPTWISTAAHGVASAIEQAYILFPYKALAEEVYGQYLRHFQEHDLTESIKIKLQEDIWGVDDWEADLVDGKPRLGVMQHIDECINETCAIIRDVTPNGTERFELPRLAEQSEGLDMRRRDRWSALMLANYAAKVVTGHGHRPNTSIPGQKKSDKGSYTSNRVGRRGNSSWYNPN
jgi:hypothetical protein